MIDIDWLNSLSKLQEFLLFGIPFAIAAIILITWSILNDMPVVGAIGLFPLMSVIFVIIIAPLFVICFIILFIAIPFILTKLIRKYKPKGDDHAGN